MFWASIKIISHSKIDDAAKINAKSYCKFLDTTFLCDTGYNQEALS